MEVSKRGASAGTHGYANLERQRAPDSTPRGSQGIRYQQGADIVDEGGAVAVRTYVEKVTC